MIKRLALAVLLMAACDSTPVPTRLAIEPDGVTIWQDQETELNAVVYDQNDKIYMDPVMITWSVNNPIIATVDSGVVTPHQNGEVRITVIAAEHSLTASATVKILKVNFLESAAAYIVQANQYPDNPIPVIAGRDGLLRIHIAEDLSYAPPKIRVRAEVDGTAFPFDELLTQKHSEILDEVDPSSLDYSYNVRISGDIIQSGLELHLTYDPEDEERAIAGEERIEVNVVTLDHHRQVLVPVTSIHHPSDESADWVQTMTEDHPHMLKAAHVLPIADRTIIKHAPFETDANLWHGYEPWLQILTEMYALRRLENRLDHYYYGAIKPPYFPGGGIYGIGYVGWPVSTGHIHGETFAHEVGHNMNLAHAPCGVSGDPRFPDRGGLIGHWGWNPATGQILNPNRWTDIMGYCPTTWVHPYHFYKAIRHRKSDLHKHTTHQPVLMVWGGVLDDEVYLEPVLQISGQPTLPDLSSPHILEGYDHRGMVVFTHHVPMHDVSHIDAQGFNVLIPVPPVPVSSITLSGPNGMATLASESTSPLAVIVDATTGEVRAIRRNWQGEIPAGMSAIITTGLPENR